MNLMEDPLTVVSDLRPAGIERLAEDTYARRRAGDLARALGEPAPARLPAASGLPASAGRLVPAGGLRSRVLARRVPGPRVLVAAGAGLAAAAVAAAVLIAVPSHGHPAHGAQAGVVPVGVVPAGRANSSHAVLLTAAHIAAAQPAAAGTYWYVKERDFEPSTAVYAGKIRPKDGTAAKDPGFGASFAATEETWTGASRTRTIVNESLVFGFASAAGKKRWEAAGSPKLASQAGFGLTGPVTSNYAFGGSYNIGAINVGLAAAWKLPTTPGKLGVLLRKGWNGLTAQQQEATVGVASPSYAQYLFQVAGDLLTGPVTPGTRAAVYGLLAKQPGLPVALNVTDPLGRTGTAIGDGTGDFLIISPATAQVLDLTTYPVRTGTTISGKPGGTEAYLSTGWSGRLGTPAGS